MARQLVGRQNRPAAEVATVNGKKRLLVGGRLVQTKADATLSFPKANWLIRS